MANVGTAIAGKTLIGTGVTSQSAFASIGTSSGLTAHGVVVAEGSGAFQATAAGSAGQVLQSGGASADPVYSTATYPSTAGTSTNVLTSDGTNWISAAAPSSGVTINGNTGSVSGTSFTFSGLANGGTATFNGTGSNINLRFSNGNFNTILGDLSGNGGNSNTGFGANVFVLLGFGSGTKNSVFGNNSGLSIIAGSSNSYYGQGCGGANDGDYNSVFGENSLINATAAIGNSILGRSSGNTYTTTESYNTLIGYNVAGVIGESNVTRIADATSPQPAAKCYAGGISGVTAVGSIVLVGSDGQLTDLGFGSAGQVLTSNGAGVSPSWV